MSREPGLFHRFVCRAAGLAERAITGLRADRAAAFLEEMLRCEDRMRESREAIALRLRSLIAAEFDRAYRGRLLDLRRRLQGQLPVRPDWLESLTGKLRQEVETLLVLQGEHARHREAFEKAFAEETREARRRFRQTLTDEDFQSSLLLSSRALYQAQERYFAAPAEELRARERQIERGLLKYLTRMVMKATPFARFCSVFPGLLTDPEAGAATAPPALRFAGDPLRKRGHARLNKGFLEVLFHHLANDPVVRRRFKLRLNPTLRLEGKDGLVFLASPQGRETFQRLRSNPALELIRDLLAEAGTQRTLEEAVRELERQPRLQASQEEIEAYVNRLIEIGFLRLAAGIPTQELDWDLAFREMLAGAGDGLAQDTAALLRALREITEAYDAAPVAERAALLDRMTDRFDTFRREHGLPVRIGLPLYEDAAASATAILPRSPEVRAIERALVEFVELTSRICLPRCELADMRHFYDSRYGAVESVPLLRFYEDFYREHYKDHLDRAARVRLGEMPNPGTSQDMLNPFGLDRTAKLCAARDRFLQMLNAYQPISETPEEIDLAAADLRELFTEVEPLPSTGGWSVELYGDLVAPLGSGEGARLVVRHGSYFTGFGKMFSRFLYLFPREFEADLRRNNESLARDVLAELCDDANRNANLHPPLLPEEISHAGESRGRGAGILPTDLLVAPDPGDPGLLELRHAGTGRRIFPVDTGFMSSRARPPLHRLLSAFTPGPVFLVPPARGAGLENGFPPAVLVRPRIAFEGRLILMRRTWRVPGPLYPKKLSATETERDYFVRISRWRREHGVPEEVYLTFHSLPGGPELSPESRRPQYVDFASPLLASLFGHLAPAHDHFVALLEERLPGRGALARHNGEPLVTEMVLQLDFP